MAARKLCRPVASVDRAATGQVILAVPERETRHTTWSGEYVLPDREDFRAIMMVERVGQSDVFPSCPSLREHTVCTVSVTNWQPSPTMHAHMLSTDPPVFSTRSRKFGRSLMESTAGGEFKSGIVLGIIGTACLFCVAGQTGG